jgi:transposase
VCAMEDVLEVYKQPYDPEFPVVCLDELQKQLVAEIREPLRPRPGQPERYDSHYRRAGVGQLFLMVEPLRGWRHVEVREHKTSADWAEVIRRLLTRHYPRARRVRLIMDNLNTHALGALYETFAPAEARALCERLELHYTPKHASWLNMAEIELSALARQCLNRRLGNLDTVKREVSAWEKQRNREQAQIHWQFTTGNARIKLRRLYPTFND